MVIQLFFLKRSLWEFGQQVLPVWNVRGDDYSVQLSYTVKNSLLTSPRSSMAMPESQKYISKSFPVTDSVQFTFIVNGFYCILAPNRHKIFEGALSPHLKEETHTWIH